MCRHATISMMVLVVDDNDLLCQMTARIVSRRVLFCYSVGDAKSALSEIRSLHYDLVFLDVHLPDGNGLDLVPEIKRLSPDTKVVIMSSDGSEMNVKRALARGALRFLHKPFDSSQVDEILQAVFPGR